MQFFFSFVNLSNVDFTSVDGLPVSQEFVLSHTDDSLPLRYSTRAAKFFNVNALTLLLEGAADGGNQIEIDYLGFEGEFSQVNNKILYFLLIINRVEWVLLKLNTKLSQC